MQPTLDTTKPEPDAMIMQEVRDSPSQRVTLPMASPEFGDVEQDEGDRNDGENWFENNVQRGAERPASDQPLIIEDEPTGPHEI